jgi:hypothetical protein
MPLQCLLGGLYPERRPMEHLRSVLVRCGGHKHKITVTLLGPLILHDHDRASLTAERALVALGGEPCGCIQFLEAWRHNVPALPPALQDIRKNLERLARYRRHRQDDIATDPYKHPFRERLASRLHTWRLMAMRRHHGLPFLSWLLSDSHIHYHIAVCDDPEPSMCVWTAPNGAGYATLCLPPKLLAGVVDENTRIVTCDANVPCEHRVFACFRRESESCRLGPAVSFSTRGSKGFESSGEKRRHGRTDVSPCHS